MKKIFLVVTVLVASFGFSQEVKLKKGQVLVDGSVWLNYQDCGTFDKTCSLLNKDKEEIIFFKWVTVPNEGSINKNGTRDNLVYTEVKFLGLNKLFEIQKLQKNIIAMLFNSKVLNENGTLNEDKVSVLIEKYGTEFSDKLNKTNNSQTIIIQHPEPQRSGVNINIGR
jgi:hypothetical protein